MNISLTISVTPEVIAAINSLTAAVSGIGQLKFDFGSTGVPSAAPTSAPAVAPSITPTVSAQPPVIVTVTDPALIEVAPAPATTVPATAPTYTIEQLAVAATQLMDAGKRPELVNLLTQFGVQALTALPKEQYGNFATQLRTLGAKI